jgi:hypothetical protein
VLKWFDLVMIVVIIALTVQLVIIRPRGAPISRVAFFGASDPDMPYRVFCRDHDVEVEADRIDGVPGIAGSWMSDDMLAEINKGFGAWRVRYDFAALDGAARIRAATSPEALADTVVSLLVDHSGSMRGQPMLLTAGTVMMASDLLESLGAKQEVLGFTTVRWKGGLSREKWVRSGRPSYPGRLNDLLHIIYRAAGSGRMLMRHHAIMLREGLLKENLDGEAVAWAASRLRQRGESRKYLIVVSDGAPVDDSTLMANGGDYLEKHLRSVIHEIAEAGDIQLAAIGIGHDVSRYYGRSIVVNAPDDLGNAALQLIEQLLSAPSADASGPGAVAPASSPDEGGDEAGAKNCNLSGEAGDRADPRT